MTLHASELTGTRLYVGEAYWDYDLVHVLAYSNTAKTAGPNAMILPLPAAEMLTAENLIDTRSFPGFLNDIAEATKEQVDGGLDYDRNEIEIVEVGSYTVVLASNAKQVPAALERVMPHRRPALNEEVVASFEKNYPGCPLTVCCWDGTIEAEPLLLWYKPLHKEVFFAPSLDAHDGKAPRKELVKVDTIVSFGSTLLQPVDLRNYPRFGRSVRYEDKIPAEVQQLLPKYAVGTRLERELPNGDFYYSREVLRSYYQEPSRTPGSMARQFPEVGAHKEAIPLGKWH